MVRWALLLFLVSGSAGAEEPLWTEGARGGLPANAPINMQSFVKLAAKLGQGIDDPHRHAPHACVKGSEKAARPPANNGHVNEIHAKRMG